MSIHDDDQENVYTKKIRGIRNTVLVTGVTMGICAALAIEEVIPPEASILVTAISPIVATKVMERIVES